MKSQTNLFIGIGTALIVLVAGFLIFMPNNKMHTDQMSGTATTSNAVATNSASIENYMFSPMAIKVKAGTTVTWTNKDSVHHSVTADTVSSDAPNGQLIAQGQTFSFTFKKAGTYTIHCMPHPYMHETVVVT